MIDRYTVIGAQVRYCPDCGSDTTWSVLDSTERGYLGFDGQRRSCEVCSREEEVRRDGEEITEESVQDGLADEISDYVDSVEDPDPVESEEVQADD